MPLARAFIAAIMLIANFLVAGCGEDPIIVPTRSFDRPTDMAFVCMVRDARGLVTGQPMSVCHPGGAQPDPQVDLDSLETRSLGTFGLLTNTARGELAAIDFDRDRLVDLIDEVPGFNMLPVGTLPETVDTSSDGCKALTANQGSCNLGFVDSSRLLQRAFEGPSQASSDSGSNTSIAGTVRSVVVQSANGALLARPSEARFLPQNLASDAEPFTVPAYTCSSAGAYDSTTPQTPVPWRAVVVFPNCGAVATIALPSGEIISAVKITDDAVVEVGANLSCAADCPSAAVQGAVAVDAGAPESMDAAASPGAAASGGVRPSALEILPDGSRIYVGAHNLDVILALDVGADGTLSVPANGGRIQLHENAQGVRRLRLSVDPHKPAKLGQLGGFVGARGEFLYVFAEDGSVRVVDVGARASGLEQECDVSKDELLVPEISRTQGCIPVEGASTSSLPRSLFARGPGLNIPSALTGPSVAPPIGIDIAFSQLGDPAVRNSDPNVFAGAFGHLILSTGTTLIVNVDPVTREFQDRTPLSHTFRNDAVGQADVDEGTGPPRFRFEPISTLSTGGVPLATRASLPRILVPRIEGLDTDNPTLNRISGQPTVFGFFPREREVSSGEQFAVTWEGILPGGVRGSGLLQPGSATENARLVDAGAQFCAMGARGGDIARINGCSENAACGEGFTCLQATPAAPGLCLRTTAIETLGPLCERFTATRMRYTISQASLGQLELELRPDELARPTLAQCQSDNDCRIGPGYDRFVCAELTAGEGARCVNPCSAPVSGDSECREGFVCEDIGSALGSVCVEAPPIQPEHASCFEFADDYSVHAGHAFFMTSSALPTFSDVAEIDGRCQPRLPRPRRMNQRIPLSAQACPQAITNTEQALLTTPGTDDGAGNPCLFIGTNGDEDPSDATSSTLHVKALFESPNVRFVLTNLEQPFGDGLTISFEAVGGFLLDGVSNLVRESVAVPMQIVTGPSEVIVDTIGGQRITSPFHPYLYIVDGGRLAPTGNRGQILRLDSRLGQLNTPLSEPVFQIQ